MSSGSSRKRRGSDKEENDNASKKHNKGQDVLHVEDQEAGKPESVGKTVVDDSVIETPLKGDSSNSSLMGTSRHLYFGGVQRHHTPFSGGIMSVPPPVTVPITRVVKQIVQDNSSTSEEDSASDHEEVVRRNHNRKKTKRTVHDTLKPDYRLAIMILLLVCELSRSLLIQRWVWDETVPTVKKLTYVVFIFSLSTGFYSFRSMLVTLLVFSSMYVLGGVYNDSNIPSGITPLENMKQSCDVPVVALPVPHNKTHDDCPERLEEAERRLWNKTKELADCNREKDILKDENELLKSDMKNLEADVLSAQKRLNNTAKIAFHLALAEMFRYNNASRVETPATVNTKEEIRPVVVQEPPKEKPAPLPTTSALEIIDTFI